MIYVARAYMKVFSEMVHIIMILIVRLSPERETVIS